MRPAANNVKSDSTDMTGFDFQAYEYIKEQIDLESFASEDKKILREYFILHVKLLTTPTQHKLSLRDREGGQQFSSPAWRSGEEGGGIFGQRSTISMSVKHRG
jgi:hypothetical protein